MKSSLLSSRVGNKKEERAHVKEQIKQIMRSVKEQKQHIENILHQNDQKIQQYAVQYQKIRKQTDLDYMNEKQQTIFKALVQGLQQMNVDPALILGKSVHIGKKEQTKQISKKQIIAIQQLIIAQLQYKVR